MSTTPAAPDMQSLLALEAYGLLCQLPAVQKGEDEIYFQQKNDQLFVGLKSWPSFWERVWSGKPSVPDIYRMACISLRQQAVAMGRGSRNKIQVALDALNAQIASVHTELIPLTIPQSIPPLSASIPVRGLQNPCNKCYANATLVLLCASSRFQELLLNQQPMSETAVYLRLVFQALQTSGPSLSHYARPMSDFITSMVTSFPALRVTICASGTSSAGFSQQDAAEFMGGVLARTIGDGCISYREIVERRTQRHAPLTSSIAFSRVLIPAVDGRGPANAHIERTNIFTVTVEELGDHKLQEYFYGIDGEEQVQKSAIGPPCVAKRLKGRELPDMPVNRRRIFTASPRFLPIQIARFNTTYNCAPDGSLRLERVKIDEPVDVPYQLAIPVDGRAPVPYTLCGVLPHLGESMDTGHYIGYVPDRSSPLTSDGMPSRWFVFNDSVVTEVEWQHIAEEVLSTCYLLLYDEQ